MKKILIPSLVLMSLFFFGCNKHQYVFLEGAQGLHGTNEFLIENDSLEILYNFSGQNIPVKIRVTNKSDKPVYIDWKKSVAVIDGKMYKYWHDEADIEISGINTGVYFSGDGQMLKDERITYIAPQSYIESTRLFLQTALFQDLADHKSERLQMLSENGPVKVKGYDFTRENSPLIFRSILTYSARESFSEETLLENTFWVSDIFESSFEKLSPQQHHLPLGEGDIHNSSRISSKTSFGKATSTFSLLGITTGLLIIATLGGQ